MNPDDNADAVEASEPARAPLPGTRSPRPARPRHRPKRLARGMFYAHLWLGIVATAILLVISITGVLLNHKRGLGLMPDVPHEASAAFDDALPLPVLVRAAEAAAGPDVAAAGVDRMDVRPGDGLVKVRFDDRRVSEVTLDINTAEVLHVGERNDVFLEKLHSGEIFGDLWVLLSDAGAVLLLIVLVSGYWLWLYPKRHA